MSAVDHDSDKGGFEKHEIEDIGHSRHHVAAEALVDMTPAGMKAHADDNIHVTVTFRSWLIVFICCVAIFAQVYAVVACAQVIAFVIRDLGRPDIAGWTISGLTLTQSVLSPVFGRLSDLVDRKWLSAVPPLFAVVGSIVCAKAPNMNVLIGGSILIGITLPSVAVVTAIVAEILPLRYRAIANGCTFLAGGFAGLAGALSAGALVQHTTWRNIYWVQLGLHAFTSAGFLLFYFPPPVEYPRLSFKQFLWHFDALGTFILTAGATLTLLGLTWAGSTYPWRDAHVLSTLIIGLLLLVAFCLYEWKGRNDGIMAHVFFQNNRNFVLGNIAFAVEGFIFYSAVNQFQNQVVLNLGFETDSFGISVRQLFYNVTIIIASVPVIVYSTHFRDLKSPLLLCFAFFLATCACYAAITPEQNGRQHYVYNILSGIGQSGPLTTIVAIVQFTAPHAYLSTATGLAFCARAFGGSFGSAIMGTIINTKVASAPAKIGAAAIAQGLPASSVTALVTAMAEGIPLTTVPGTNAAIIAAATMARENVYAHAYRVAWAALIPFVVVAMGAIAMLSGVKDQMTWHTEAPLSGQAAKIEKAEHAENTTA